MNSDKTLHKMHYDVFVVVVHIGFPGDSTSPGAHR